MALKCIVSMVKPDLTDKVVDAAKKAGARGATIVPASGTGKREAKTFFGLTLDVRTDVVLFLLPEELVDTVLDAIYAAGRFDKPGTGIAFVMPVDAVRGLESQLQAGNV
jgi:nitrogen regulatory protein PII